MTNEQILAAWQQNRRAWIAALRSGDYAQGRNLLCFRPGGSDPVQYCCLGVAAQLFATVRTDIRYASGMRHMSFDGCDVECPPYAVSALGLRNEMGVPKPGSVDDAGNKLLPLTALNDNGASFADIANVLERYPDAYFATTPDAIEWPPEKERDWVVLEVGNKAA